MKRIATLCIAMSAAALFGCTPIEPPEGYIRDSSSHAYDFKAVSARGNVIACNVRANENSKADLKYWSDAVEYQKVDIDGMRLAGRETITSNGGTKGVLFNFESGEGQGKTAYLVALYVTPMRIYTIEATGPADSITRDMDKLKASMQSIR